MRLATIEARSLAADLAAAGLLSAALHWAWPGLAPASDPLRGTVVAFPAFVAGLRWCDRRLGTAPAAWEPVAAAVAVIMVLLRSRLGWPALDAPAAAALLAGVGAAVARRVLHLDRASAERGRPQTAGAVFFVLPLLVYLLIQPWCLTQRAADGDEPYYLLLAHSLAHDFDLDLRDEYADEVWRYVAIRPVNPQPGDPMTDGGEVHSRHDPLLPMVLAPGTALGGRSGAAATMALLAAALAWATHDLARRRFPDRPRGTLAAWAVLAFAPPLVVYAHQIWVEVPAALCLALALGRIARWESRPPSATSVLAFVVPVALLPLLKLRFLLVAAPLLALGGWRVWRLSRRPQATPSRGVWLLLALPVLAAGAVTAWNAGVYGRLLKLSRTGELDVLASGLPTYVRGAVGMFWDGAFGLFPFAPIWLLLLPAVGWTIRHGDRRRSDLVALFALALPTLVALAPRLEWYGGWSPPFRYPLVLLPLFAVTLVPLLDRPTTAVRASLVALGGATAVLTAAWIAVPGWTYTLADGSSDLADAAGRLLGADVAAILPSTVSARPATWFWVVASLGWAGWILISRPTGSRASGAHRSVRRAEVFACAALLGVVGLVPTLAARLPTRVAEVESAWIPKRGGELTPDPWIVARPRFRGGWLLSTGASLEIPVVADGSWVRLQIVASRRGELPPDRIAIWRAPAAGGDPIPLDTWIVPTEGWSQRQLDPVPWNAGDTLLVTSPQPSLLPRLGVVVDRVEFEWLADAPPNASETP